MVVLAVIVPRGLSAERQLVHRVLPVFESQGGVIVVKALCARVGAVDVARIDFNGARSLLRVQSVGVEAADGVPVLGCGDFLFFL